MSRPCALAGNVQALRPFFSFLLYALRPAPFLFFFILPRPGARAQLKREEARKGPSIIIKNRESVSPPLPG